MSSIKFLRMFSERDNAELGSTVPAVPHKCSGTRPRVMASVEPLCEVVQSSFDDGSGDVDPVHEITEDCGVALAEHKSQLTEDNFDDHPIERPSQLQALLNEAERASQEGSVTVPDVGAYKMLGSQKARPMLAVVQMEAELRGVCSNDVRRTLGWAQDERSWESGQEVSPVGNDDGVFGEDSGLRPTRFLSESEALSQIQALRTTVSSLPPKEKTLLLVEKHYAYNYPWWESQNALIRLWGQLDCALQVLGDSRLLKDLSQVLGMELINFDRDRSKERGYTFAYLTENAAELKDRISTKYSNQRVVLDAIVGKKDRSVEKNK